MCTWFLSSPTDRVAWIKKKILSTHSYVPLLSCILALLGAFRHVCVSEIPWGECLLGICDMHSLGVRNTHTHTRTDTRTHSLSQSGVQASDLGERAAQREYKGKRLYLRGWHTHTETHIRTHTLSAQTNAHKHNKLWTLNGEVKSVHCVSHSPSNWKVSCLHSVQSDSGFKRQSFKLLTTVSMVLFSTSSKHPLILKRGQWKGKSKHTYKFTFCLPLSLSSLLLSHTDFLFVLVICNDHSSMEGQ